MFDISVHSKYIEVNSIPVLFDTLYVTYTYY